MAGMSVLSAFRHRQQRRTPLDARVSGWLLCEPVTAGSLTPRHVRLACDEAPRTGGGLPEGTYALCGQPMERGWDVTGVPVGFDELAAESAARPGVCVTCLNSASSGPTD
jgi:hypothetical protein